LLHPGHTLCSHAQPRTHTQTPSSAGEKAVDSACRRVVHQWSRAMLTFLGMLEWAGSRLPIAAVQRGLWDVSCCCGAFPPNGKVNDILAHACMPLLLLPGHSSLHNGAATTCGCSSSRSLARHRVSLCGEPHQHQQCRRCPRLRKRSSHNALLIAALYLCDRRT
jgi:hypothetical protein